MKNLHKIVLLGGVVLGLSSCSETFLDQRNPQSVDFSHVKDLKSLTAATTGTYNSFKSYNYYGRSMVVIPEILGDNTFLSVRNGGRYTNHDRFAVTNGDGYVTSLWTLTYRVIANANLALTQAETITFPSGQTVESNQLKGELLASRSLAYFDLLRLFSQPYNFTADASHPGVPLILEPAGEIISPARATVAEVYTQIIADLKAAESLLKPDKKNGYFNRAAAQALLAKIYLYQEDWENAEIYASKVIDGGLYTLLSNANYIASWGTKFSIESLFEIGFSSSDNNSANSIGYLTEPGAYGELLATEDLYDQYTATDVRRSLIIKGTRATAENPAYIIKKYPNGVSSRDDNIKVLRLSEVYLIRAEARAEMARAGNTSKTAGANADLNAIVKRADPTAATIDLSGVNLVDRIILERRKELAFEGNRLFDINRKKLSMRHISSNSEASYAYPNNRFIMPIPYGERNANPNITQNPGWN